MWCFIKTVLDRINRQVQSKFAAADFAEFFNAKVEKIREDTANTPPLSYTEIEGKWLSEFKPVTEEEV